MSSGLWVNNDGLVLQYGTQKAVPEVAGDYLAFGANRVYEATIDLSELNTSHATIVSLTSKLPAMTNFVVEKVELFSEVAMSTTSSPTLSIGLCNDTLGSGATTVNIQTSGTSTQFTTTTTVPSNGGTAFVSSLAASALSHEGDLVTISYGSTGAGNYVGASYESSTLNSASYLTATLGTATATGIIKVRIYLHGVGTISQ